ncbi:hypothetical protein M2326_002140 [Flavobacterium sp. 7A]|nr:hypothetical protein [Flavobacterium sp. 7A]
MINWSYSNLRALVFLDQNTSITNIYSGILEYTYKEVY